MSIIEDYLKSAGGSWLKADSVSTGYRVLIEDVWLDDQSFDRPYICVSGVGPSGEAVKARLGVQNVERVAEVLGTKREGWIGNYLEVIGTQSYPGVGAKGILWRGVKKAAQAQRGVGGWPTTG